MEPIQIPILLNKYSLFFRHEVQKVINTKHHTNIEPNAELILHNLYILQICCLQASSLNRNDSQINWCFFVCSKILKTFCLYFFN